MSWYPEIEKMLKKGKLAKTLKVSVLELIDLKDRLEIAEKKLNNVNNQIQAIPPVPKRPEPKPDQDKDKAFGETHDFEMQEMQMKVIEKEQIIIQLKTELEANQKKLVAFAAQLETLSSEPALPSPPLPKLPPLPEPKPLPGQSQPSMDSPAALADLEHNNKLLEAEVIRLTDVKQKNQDLQKQIGELEAMVTARTDNLDMANRKLQEFQKYKIKIEEYVTNLKADIIPKDTYETALKQVQALTLQVQTLTGENERFTLRFQEMQAQLAAKEHELKMAGPTMVMAPSLAKETSVPSASTFSSPQDLTPKPVASTTPSSASYESYYSQSTINQETARLVCPHCGASGNKISVVDDKSKIISYVPRPTYKKKNVCSQCGYDF